MSQDILSGLWKQVEGHLKEWWGDLTDDDIQRIGGSQERLVGVLQERYGYAKERAISEVQRRLHGFTNH